MSGPETDTAGSALAHLTATRLPLSSGAELVTIHGQADSGDDLPLVAFVNDTLGDRDPTNDRLRYVWVFSYCPPTVSQRILAFIPFFYSGARSHRSAPDGPPPVIFDFSRNPDTLWRRVAWYTMQALVLDPHGWVVQAGTRTYVRNEREYKKAQLQNGLSILAMYRSTSTDVPDVLDGTAFEQAFGRVVESGLAGAFLDSRQLEDVAERESASARRDVARNWEFLRQRCEEEGLFFDPLPRPPARARHALVWVAKDDLATSAPTRRFDSRFLNVASPWNDERLREWSGFSKVFYVGDDGGYSERPLPGSRPVEMVPLALYGLDFPRIPALLVDFRSVFNSKSRALSRRAIEDVGKYILDASPGGDLKLFAVRKVLGMLNMRRGVDVGQPSRALTYAQLRTLLVLRNELDPELREIVIRDLDRAKINPLDNGPNEEVAIAHAQFEALEAQAASGAIDARIERDRDRERRKLAHGRFARAFLRVAEIASFGAYRHRDDRAADRERYAVARSLDFYGELLKDVASAPSPIEVSWDPAKFRPALAFVAEHGIVGDNAALVAAIEKIVHGAEDPSTQLLAMDALIGIDDANARAALRRLASDATLASEIRTYSVQLLDAAALEPVPQPATPSLTLAPLR